LAARDEAEPERDSDRALLAALAAHGGASIAQLARITSTSESRVSTHLGKLAVQGLAQSPMCVPGRSWALTAADRGIAAAAVPVVVDELDRDILGALAMTAMGCMKLARRVQVCPLTIRRRLGLLIGRGLVFADPRRFYSLTPAGRGALGDASLPPRWVRVEAISAAAAKDVVEPTYVNNISAAQRTNCGKLARAAAKRNKSTPFNGGGYFERMAG
jgi:hypothetical protein